MPPTTQVSTISADGVEVFYRHAGPASAPVIVLLHGFPSSSHQFRNLIPLLATRYRVIAPDLPGYGFTTVPPSRNYSYTFASLAATFSALVSALGLSRFAVYIFDYGAPTALRYALENPDSIAAIISQNGNAYDEGFGADFWAGIRKLWASGADSDREALSSVVELPFTKWQYTTGSPNPDKIQPEAYYLDQALMERPGNKQIQIDLLYDYRTNVDLYPRFHEYFRTSKVPVLTAWGKGDPCFMPPGAEAFKKDVSEEKLMVRWLDAGHFAIETNEEQMAAWIFEFFDRYKVFA
ncbi:Alpha/Beta hydrolase protein [Podospora aff. communis PSN243]|uniref:Alpha/Beta hydrolase protein n=1 Tax=Podospora aff. communis PSN243 TaxID=3040156 RepID=A0AAV9GZU5_9PEZI|nr:Alpha/Beta hydrolase protein [Podospora aff. communis PSN243]